MKTIRAYAPGRTELAGNHTDHQGGRVIAAALDCGVEILLNPNGTQRAHVESEGFEPFEIDLRDTAPVEAERFTTAGLVRGVAAGLRAQGVQVGGFDARVSSTVPPGGGLSSSAAFELALTCALECAAGAELDPVTRARIGQAAEREYFGKMCGLMDQLAVALGGIAALDFAEENPEVQRIPFDFAEHGFALCLIDTHCDHSLYTEEYSQVAIDMFAAARFMGAEKLSQVPAEAYLERFQEAREALGDVPAMRGLHYFHEMRLVDRRVDALLEDDVDAFLEATRRSGASSAQYLQNVSTFDRISQPAMAALALADFMMGSAGACRIHGGGFGGTVQAFVPVSAAEAFRQEIDRQLGEGSCRFYRISKEGAFAEL